MVVDENENVVYFDVDETLVFWDIPQGLEDESILFSSFGMSQWLWPHKHHIKLLKQFKVRGQRVIVWSQGGAQWAAEIVKTLKLEEYVDLVMTKPKWIVDDLPAHKWTSRTYLDINGNRTYCSDVLEDADWKDIDGDKKTDGT